MSARVTGIPVLLCRLPARIPAIIKIGGWRGRARFSAIAYPTRLDQHMAEWKEAGRVGQSRNAKTDQKIARLTSSLHKKTRLSIDDLSDRMAMLGDVTGRVGLMKRDLAELMHPVRARRACER